MPGGARLHLLLLIGSVIINYTLHRLIVLHRSKAVLTLGIIGNLAVLGYFKYADFFLASINPLLTEQLPMLNIILPLAISFFTFQQISFLYDTWKGDIADTDFAKYCLFVVFFPQLIAGPIVLQKDTIPQFRLSVFRKANWRSIWRWAGHSLPSACSRRSSLRMASPPWSIWSLAMRMAGQLFRSKRHGSARLPIPSRSISISPAIATWP